MFPEIRQYVQDGKLKWYQPSDQRNVDVESIPELTRQCKPLRKLAKMVSGALRAEGKYYAAMVRPLIYARLMESSSRILADISAVKLVVGTTKVRAFHAGTANQCCQALQYFIIKLRADRRFKSTQIHRTKQYRKALRAIDNVCRICGLRARHQGEVDVEADRV